ncbi:MAG: AAA family ATPase [Candidatus Acidiferrales bacterium]
MKTLRIFISSPSDVRAERVRAYDVVQRLQTKFRAFIKIEPILWEDEPMRATSSFQAQISKPSESDVVICVLWAKIGTRLPRNFRRPDGSVPTGTEWEFEDALESYKTRGTPDLLVYRKTAPPEIKVTSDQMLEEWQSQKKALDAFLNRWFRDHEGAFQAAFSAFDTDEDFEKLLEKHLEKIISLRLDKPELISWTEGSPFRGLDVFHAQHQKIFFGRDLAIAEITNRLLEQSLRGRVFLLVLGMSGCGKSSLVRAGVLPELMRLGVANEVGCWRWAILRPSEASGTLTECLASALFTEKNALPELSQLGYDVQRFADFLRDAPAHAIPLIEAALAKVSRQFAHESLRSKPPEARLILVIDQLEEMFTIERFDAAQRAAFIGAISALSRSGLVWVVATMRSDLYASCAEIEGFRALKSDDGQYDLGAPGVSETGQIIRMPALAAGLSFESHPVTHRKLDDALQEEASKSPEALPLLEFCLDELYKLRTESLLITWDAYQKLGGLNGAITKRAEEVFSSLSVAGQRAFPRVLSSLVTMDASATSRPARRKDLEANPAMAEVIASFTRANLFVTDVNQAGEPVVAVAHEALIGSWPRVQDWVHENKDFLRLKTRIAQAAHRWHESGEDSDFLLPEGKALAEAQDALTKRREELEDIEFVQSSIKVAAHRNVVRRFLAAAALTVALSLIFGSVILQQRHDALAATAAASEADFTFAADEMERNEIPVSLAYLADALRKNPENQKAIALTVAELQDSPLPILSMRHDDEVQDAEFSPDGARVVTASVDGTARIWDAKTGQQLNAQPMRHANWVHTAEFSPDGTEVITGSWDGTARVWNAQTGAEIGAPLQHNGRVLTATFSPDGTKIATACYDGTAHVWDARTLQPIGSPMQHTGPVWSARFSPDSTRVVTASADHTARVWDASTGAPISYLGQPAVLRHQDEVNLAIFSPDGKWIATGSDDGTARIWDTRTFQATGEPLQHGAPVNFASFSRDSRFVVTASSDHTARIWQVPTGKGVGQPMRHDGWVRSADFSPDGRMVITSSYDRTARIWDALTGLPLGEPLRHSGTVYMARFGKDNSTIVTASFNHTAEIWKWQQTAALPLMKQTGAMISAFFDVRGQHLATVSSQGVQIWDPVTGQPQGAPILPENSRDVVTGASFSPDGNSLLIATAGSAQVWDLAARNVVTTLKPPDPVLHAAFGPDDHLIMIVSASGISLWDAKSAQSAEPNRSVRPSLAPGDKVVNARFSPDGHVIAIYTYDGAIVLCDADSGKLIGKPMQHNGPVTNVAFSPDSQWLVTNSADHTARIWNARTGDPAGTMRVDSWVTDAEFSPDGKWIVTASSNSTAQVWDARTTQPVSQLMRHEDAVVSASFSPDSRWVVTASSDGTAQVWDAQTGIPVGKPMASASKVVTASFSPDGNWVLTGSLDGTARIWEAPVTTKKSPAWLIELAEDVGGLSLDSHGVLQTTPRDAAELRNRLNSLSVSDNVDRFGHWMASDPATRSVSPRGN